MRLAQHLHVIALGLAAVSLVAVALPFMPAGQAAAAAAAPAYATNVTIEPSAEYKGAFVFGAEITDLASGKVVAAPSLLAPANEQVEASSALEGTVSEVLFRAKAASGEATYVVVLGAAGKETVLHRATVKLPTG